VRRCGARLLLLVVVLDAWVVSYSSSSWLRGGGKNLAESVACCASGSSGSFFPAAAAAGSVALSGTHGCWASSPALQSRRAGFSPTSPPQVACSLAVVRWPELGGGGGSLESALGPDHVLVLDAGPFLHFCRVCFVIFFSLGSSLHLCNRQSLNEASFGSFETPLPLKKKDRDALIVLLFLLTISFTPGKLMSTCILKL
jgi:hypothetical protein